MFVLGSGGSGRRRCGEWMRILGLWFTNPMGIGVVCDVCLYLGCADMGGVGGEWIRDWTRVWRWAMSV